MPPQLLLIEDLADQNFFGLAAEGVFTVNSAAPELPTSFNPIRSTQVVISPTALAGAISLGAW